MDINRKGRKARKEYPFRYERQRPIPLTYGGEVIEVGFRADFVVEDAILQHGIRRLVLDLEE